MSKEKIFVYGTLMKGFENYNKYLNGYVEKITPAYTYGKLYHLNNRNCPALVEGNDKVYGEVMIINDMDGNVISQIDHLEKFFSNSLKTAYERKKTTIFFFNDNIKEEMYAYFYVSNEDLFCGNYMYIKSGDWKEYIKYKSNTK